MKKDDEKQEEKGLFTIMLEAKERLMPATGFNLVGIDEYELPGEELYLVAHYENKERAIAALRAHKQNDPMGVYYLYSAPGEEVIAADDPRTQVSRAEVLIDVGAEGGSLSLFRELTDEPRWEYFTELNQVALVDMSEAVGDPVPAEMRLVRSERVDTFEKGLRLLDEHEGWETLYPVRVHPEYRDQVWSLVSERLGTDARGRQRWKERCGRA